MKEGRKGFTLVELLIVIVVIGILSAMMMLSSTEAVTSAKANNIIAGLSTFKKALTHWYIDNLDKIYWHANDKQYKLQNVGNGINNLGDLMQKNSKLVTRYIGNSSQFKFDTKNFSSGATGGTYRFEDNGGANGRKAWFVGYTLTEAEKSSGVAKKLAGRAKSVGLLANQGTDGKQNGSYATKVDVTPYSGGNTVWMKVLSFE